MALDFNGSTQYGLVAAAPSINDLSVLSFAAWIFPTSDGDREILSKASSNRELRLKQTSPNMRLRGGVNASGTIPESESVDGSIVLNQWQHVVMTYDDGGDRKARLYIDGAEVSYALQPTGTGTITTDAGSPLNFGRRTSANRWFDGLMEDIRIYNRVLALAEAATIHGTRGIDGIVNGLVARWLLNEDAPGVVASGADIHKDLSGFGNHATPTLSPLFAEGTLRFRRRVA